MQFFIALKANTDRFKRFATGRQQHSLLNPSGIMNKVFASVALVVFLACLLEAHANGKACC